MKDGMQTNFESFVKCEEQPWPNLFLLGFAETPLLIACFQNFSSENEGPPRQGAAVPAKTGFQVL